MGTLVKSSDSIRKAKLANQFGSLMLRAGNTEKSTPLFAKSLDAFDEF